MWNYAEMSQAASNAGGPERFMEDLVNEGLEKGLKSGRMQGAIGILGLVIVAVGSKKIFDLSRKPKNQRKEIVDKYMIENLDRGIQKNDVSINSDISEELMDESDDDVEN